MKKQEKTFESLESVSEVFHVFVGKHVNVMSKKKKKLERRDISQFMLGVSFS